MQRREECPAGSQWVDAAGGRNARGARLSFCAASGCHPPPDPYSQFCPGFRVCRFFKTHGEPQFMSSSSLRTRSQDLQRALHRYVDSGEYPLMVACPTDTVLATLHTLTHDASQILPSTVPLPRIDGVRFIPYVEFERQVPRLTECWPGFVRGMHGVIVGESARPLLLSVEDMAKLIAQCYPSLRSVDVEADCFQLEIADTLIRLAECAIVAVERHDLFAEGILTAAELLLDHPILGCEAAGDWRTWCLLSR
jgi:hypothetical protein